MKELTTEQKAQRYDEAIKVAQRFYNNSVAITKKGLEDIFPELAESEDEKIRQLLLRFVEYDMPDNYSDDFSKEDCLAWFEKKPSLLTKEKALKNSPFVEQNPIDKVEPKFKIGDVIVEIKPNGYCQPVRVKYVGKESYSCESDDGKRFLSFPIINQDDYELIEQKPSWSEEDEKMWSQVINEFEAIKSNSSTVFEKNIAQDKIDFLKTLKDRVQPQPKQEWSEEDRKLIDETCDLINTLASGYGEKVTEPISFAGAQQINSIKTRLRALVEPIPQPQWKPTDKQMNTLWDAIVCIEGCNSNFKGSGSVLENLYNDLKKLKG